MLPEEAAGDASGAVLPRIPTPGPPGPARKSAAYTEAPHPEAVLGGSDASGARPPLSPHW